MQDIQKLLEKCNAEGEENYKQFYCIGYVAGIGDAMRLNGQSGLLDQMSICGEEGTYGAMVQAFMNWAQKHPERWGEHSSVGVITALRESWPCKAR
jgi:hypothetical protein